MGTKVRFVETSQPGGSYFQLPRSLIRLPPWPSECECAQRSAGEASDVQHASSCAAADGQESWCTRTLAISQKAESEGIIFQT